MDPSSSSFARNAGIEAQALRGSRTQCEFKAPWHVIVMGLAGAICLFCTGKAIALKLLTNMQTMDASSLFMLAVVFGCLAECAGGTYLYRRRRHQRMSGDRKKSGAFFVIAAMIAMLLPIQFAVLSLFVNHA